MFTQSWRSKRKKKWLGWVGRSGEESLAGEQGAASGARPPDQAPRTLAGGGTETASGPVATTLPHKTLSEHRPSSVEQRALGWGGSLWNFPEHLPQQDELKTTREVLMKQRSCEQTQEGFQSDTSTPAPASNELGPALLPRGALGGGAAGEGDSPNTLELRDLLSYHRHHHYCYFCCPESVYIY